MDWIQAFTDRFISTPAINWLDEDRFDLTVDNQKLQYSLPQKSLVSLIGRAIKRGQNLGVFVPCLGDADLALMLTYTYALWTDVHLNLSVPGRWLNRHVIDINKDVIVIGNGPSIRKLLVNRCQFGNQAIHDYLGIYWLTRNKSASMDGIFAGLGTSLEMSIYIIPKSKVTEQNFDYYQKVCHPFVIIQDLTASPSADRNLIYQYHIYKDAFPSVPVIFLCSAGDMAAMKMLRDEKGIALWVTRANDIINLEKKINGTLTGNGTALTQHSRQLANGISVTVQVIQDNYFNESLGELLALVNRIFEETKKTTAESDMSIYREARIILRELAALSVPLTTQEELHRLERRSSLYATRMLRNRIDKLGDMTGSVGLITEMANNLVRKLNELTDILAKTQAITGKTRAVAQWVKQRMAVDDDVIVACPNESTRTAMIAYLSMQDIDTINDPIRITTHNGLWRYAKDTPVTHSKVLWIGAPDFYSGAFFGGILPDITLMIYLNERESLETQLRYIEHNTQKLSRRTGDKLTFLRDMVQPIEDRQVVDESDSPWLLNWIELDLAGTYPGDIPKIEPFTG